MAINKKFATPFSGAADRDSDAWEEAAKAAPFPADQVDESRKGAMRGAPKYAMDVDCEKMQSTGEASDGFTVWKKMETF